MKVPAGVRSLYFKSSAVRALANAACWLLKPENRIGAGHLVAMPEAAAYGPVQREEALLLFGVVRAVRPKTIVEFGFCGGRSAFNFLQALPPDGRLYSFDIDPGPAQLAREHFTNDPRFIFLQKSQAEFMPADIDKRAIDFAFIDAAHDLALNQETFRRLQPSLAPRGLVAVHDTGTWSKAHFTPFHEGEAKAGRGTWLNQSEFQHKHQADERRFVNWIVETYPEWKAVHFHSENCLRHGLTLLQRSGVLATNP